MPRPQVRVKRSKNMYISGFELHIIRTWLSRPTVNNIKKKSTDHSCGIGNVDNASGYTMNAIPGPVEILNNSCESKTVVPVSSSAFQQIMKQMNRNLL